MKPAAVTLGAVAAVLVLTAATATGNGVPKPKRVTGGRPHATSSLPVTGKHETHRLSPIGVQDVIRKTCQTCHNSRTLKGNLSLEGFNPDSALAHADVAEKMIRKMRAQIMPPPGSRKPGGDTLVALVQTLEEVMDKAEKGRPNPGDRTFQRLNRPEYERTVRDLLGVEINAGDFLPLDTKSANFDNIADVQALSSVLLESYLNAAAAVTDIALGNPKAPNMVKVYSASTLASQHPWDHVEGAPYGTRGGIVADHPFPADGMYTFRLNIEGGVGVRLEDVDISIDGVRVALLHYEKGVERSVASADNLLGADYIKSEPIRVKAGQQRVSIAFVRRMEGPYEDLIKPHDWSQAGHTSNSSGTTLPPHMIDVSVVGPEKPLGVSDTPSRRKVFSCRPHGRAEEAPCAERIMTRLATRAYRRPVTPRDVQGLMTFYKKGAANGGFEGGVRMALQAMLASPYFVFRFEPAPLKVAPGAIYTISDIDLASRLSFFLWGSIPDDELLTLARQKQLSKPVVLNREVRRMLADPRSEALSTRFAAQWLRLQDVEKVRPDVFWFPDYDLQLGEAMVKETELFFGDAVRRDRSLLDLFTADYTFVNERLARHYGIPNVSGTEFRRVSYPDSSRRGLLGHGSVLVQTSLANRTSPVLRGKWVMQVIIGMPPPNPPPNVPSLDETEDAKDGKSLTTRQRMEIHRRNPTCNACHQYMDPIGLALDNFDVTGRWRYRENGSALDTRGTMYDGTSITSPMDLNKSLLSRPIPLTRSFAENLMAYAVGRRMEDFDQPTIRAIARQAEANGYKISSFIAGVVNSPAFRSRKADAGASTDSER